MQSINLCIAVLAFEQLTDKEKQAFLDPRLMFASSGAVRDEARIRL